MQVAIVSEASILSQLQLGETSENAIVGNMWTESTDSEHLENLLNID